MPKSKSPSRSGKSTPTKARPKDEDKALADEEEERLRQEEAERKRLEQEAMEILNAERLEALAAVREQQENETYQELETIRNAVREVLNDRRATAEWKRYMRCDGKPDPTSLKQVNTFVVLCKEKGNADFNVVLEDVTLILSLIDELKMILEDLDKDDQLEKSSSYNHTILALEELLMNRYNEATLKLLKEASYEADSETGNLQKVIRGVHEIFMLWGNLNKNPRFKSFEFESEKFQFDLPKVLAMADIAVRALRTNFDHYSHLCTSFLPKPIKKVEANTLEVPITDETAEATEPKEDADETKSVVTDGRKSVMSEMSNREEDKKPEEERKTTEDPEGVSQPPEVAPTPEVNIEAPSPELEDILDPDVVDLRQCTTLGGVYHIELLQMPPQPKVVRGWTLTQIIDEPLTNVVYPMDSLAGKPLSRAGSATAIGKEDGPSPSKTPQEQQQQPPIGITLKLPDDVMFFEEPQVAAWDKSDKHWKNSGIADSPTYDEENRMISFKINEFGIFSLMQDAHLNMPFQSWELKPKGVDAAVLTITAAIAEAEIEIKGTQCRLITPTDDPPKELSHIFDKWMSARELIERMRAAGVNLFPASDSNKFVSIQEKKISMEDIYDQMAVLSSAFAFQWSKWNNVASKTRIAIQTAPFFINSDDHKARFTVPDDNWSTYLVSDDRCYKLAITEFDKEFKEAIAPDVTYYCDLIHALRLGSLQGDSDGKILESLNQRSKSANKYFVDTVQTLLRATKIISYS